MAEQKQFLNDCNKVQVDWQKPSSPCKPFPILQYENPCRNIYLTKKQKKEKKRAAAAAAKNGDPQKDPFSLLCDEINKSKLEKNKRKGKKKSKEEENDEESTNKLDDNKEQSKTENPNTGTHNDDEEEADEDCCPYDNIDLQTNFDAVIEIKLKKKRKFAPGDYKYVPSILRDKTIVRKCNDNTWSKRLAYSELIRDSPPKPIILDPSPDFYRRMDEQKTTHCFYSNINYPGKIWKRHLPRLPRLIGVDKHHLQCFLNPSDTLYKYMKKLYPCVKEKEPCLCCLCQQKSKKNSCFPCT